jgi:DNA-binding NarL/FixJ family response regulator
MELPQALVEALAIKEPAAAPPDPLSAREAEILALLVQGLTNRAIGVVLFISERSVDSHVARLFRKLKVRSRAEAIATARAARLIPHLDAAS